MRKNYRRMCHNCSEPATDELIGIKPEHAVSDASRISDSAVLKDDDTEKS